MRGEERDVGIHSGRGDNLAGSLPFSATRRRLQVSQCTRIISTDIHWPAHGYAPVAPAGNHDEIWLAAADPNHCQPGPLAPNNICGGSANHGGLVKCRVSAGGDVEWRRGVDSSLVSSL